MTRRGWSRIASLLLLIVASTLLYRWFTASYGQVDWAEVFSSRESIRAFVERFDPYVPVAFFVLQVVQVVVAPIPGNVTAVAGGALLGLWGGFLVSTLGLLVGSLIAFGLARYFGRPVVETLVAPEIVNKYVDTMANRHFVVLLAIFLVPFFPDDALCFVAGLSALPVPAFLLLVVLSRPPGMFVASLVGSGVAVIPWWGWGIIILGSGALLLVVYRYKKPLERKLGLNEEE
ncbi:MAG: TVP38/TMEM64 family protein [Spirochaetaceae bacterium]